VREGGDKYTTNNIRDIIKMIISRRSTSAEDAGRNTTYEILVGKLGYRPLGRPRRRMGGETSVIIRHNLGNFVV
jgi:hypothetical protein